MSETETMMAVSLPPIRSTRTLEAQLYLLINDQPSGPIARSELIARVRRGEISRETLCATAGADAWVKVGDIVPPPKSIALPVGIRIGVAAALIIAAPLLPVLFNASIAVIYISWAVGFLILMFTPIDIARRRNHPSRTAIAILSITLGWTLIGWIVAMCWALSGADEK